MTVAELIQKLSEYPSEMEVVTGDGWEEITSVFKDDNHGLQSPVVVID